LFSKGATALGCASQGLIASPAIAQPLKSVKFTLPWLANGSTCFPYIAKHLGVFKKYGLDVSISRGFGSVASAQAVGAGQFDFGMSFAGAVILNAARGLPLISLGTFSYDSAMGALLLADGPIQSAKDFEGKKVGIVPTGADAPYWPAFLQKAGLNPASITLVQCDARVLEQALMNKQVDAASCIATSSLPIVIAAGQPCHFMLWSQFGLRQYAGQLIARKETLDADPQLCEAVVAAMFEGLATAMKDPEASLDIFFKEVPEASLAKGARENARLSQGLMHYTVISPEAEQHALGYCDMAAADRMIDSVMEFAGATGLKRPAVSDLFTNRFTGGAKFSSEEWSKIKAQNGEYGKLLA
jgi:ABC-type nitrate/sulfonate/bicarbonate transport system substrate-binding protein